MVVVVALHLARGALFDFLMGVKPLKVVEFAPAAYSAGGGITKSNGELCLNIESVSSWIAEFPFSSATQGPAFKISIA
jgi:hypothetical protein